MLLYLRDPIFCHQIIIHNLSVFSVSVIPSLTLFSLLCLVALHNTCSTILLHISHTHFIATPFIQFSLFYVLGGKNIFPVLCPVCVSIYLVLVDVWLVLGNCTFCLVSSFTLSEVSTGLFTGILEVTTGAFQTDDGL